LGRLSFAIHCLYISSGPKQSLETGAGLKWLMVVGLRVSRTERWRGGGSLATLRFGVPKK